MRSQGISLLNFPNCMDFSELFMVHSTGQERSTIANLKLKICTQLTCHKGASPPWTPLPRVVATGPDFWDGLIQNWLPAPFLSCPWALFPEPMQSRHKLDAICWFQNTQIISWNGVFVQKRFDEVIPLKKSFGNRCRALMERHWWLVPVVSRLILWARPGAVSATNGWDFYTLSDNSR